MGPSSPAPERIADLVEQLAAPRLQDRQSAVRQIEALGPPVLPLLPEPSRVESLAAREALGLLRQRLERRLEIEATQAAEITLQDRLAPNELLSAISQQTGNALRFEPTLENSHDLDVQWQAIPFWNAITDLEQRTHRQIRWPRLATQFQLVPITAEAKDLARATSGPFRMTVRKIEARETDVQRLARFHCVLQAEPRLHPLFVQWPLRDWKLQTSGEPQSCWNPDAVYELPFPDGEREVSLAIDFPWAPSDLPQDWKLEGRCSVHLAAGREPLRFAGSELRRGATARRGGMTGQLRMVRFEDSNAGTLEAVVRLVINHDRGGPAFESHRLGLFQRSAWLESETGDKQLYAKMEVVAEVDGGMAMEYHFTKLPGPATRYQFVYEGPTLLLEVPVQIRLDGAAAR
jgi:hypothetical protein